MSGGLSIKNRRRSAPGVRHAPWCVAQKAVCALLPLMGMWKARVTASKAAAAGGALFSRFTGLMLLLAGALVAYVQARPDAVRALAEARAQGPEFDRSRHILPWFGLGLAVAGLLWLVAGAITGDLLPALALIACGFYGGLPALQLRGLVQEVLAARLQPFGLIVTAAAAVLGVVHLLFGTSSLV